MCLLRTMAPPEYTVAQTKDLMKRCMEGDEEAGAILDNWGKQFEGMDDRITRAPQPSAEPSPAAQ